MIIDLYCVQKSIKQCFPAKPAELDTVWGIVSVAKIPIRDRLLKTVLMVSDDGGTPSVSFLLADAAGFTNLTAGWHHKILAADIEVAVQGRG